MGVPTSIRLDDDVHDELEAQVRARGVGLSTLVRELATTAAREARRVRIREASAGIKCHILTLPDARAFYEGWSMPRDDGGARGKGGLAASMRARFGALGVSRCRRSGVSRCGRCSRGRGRRTCLGASGLWGRRGRWRKFGLRRILTMGNEAAAEAVRELVCLVKLHRSEMDLHER